MGETSETFVDEEGFEQVATRKVKRERRISNRLSTSETEGLTTSKEQPEASKSKPDGISLPITEMTDDWMDDDVAIGSIESDEEETGADKTTSCAKVECQV